jgi:ankyrin repeat protein
LLKYLTVGDINEDDGHGFSALLIAAEKGESKIVEILLNSGCDIDRQSSGGLTALSIAASLVSQLI